MYHSLGHGVVGSIISSLFLLIFPFLVGVYVLWDNVLLSWLFPAEVNVYADASFH